MTEPWVEQATKRYVYYGHENRVTEEEYARRLSICEPCQYLSKGTEKCSLCTCNMPRKARFKNFDCPKGKWSIDDPETPVECPPIEGE